MDVPDVNGFPVDADVNAVVREAAELLSGLGHRVEVSHPEAMTDPEFLDRWLQLLSPTVTAMFDDLETLAGRPLERGDAEEMAWWWRDRGAEIGAARHIANQDWLHAAVQPPAPGRPPGCRPSGSRCTGSRSTPSTPRRQRLAVGGEGRAAVDRRRGRRPLTDRGGPRPRYTVGPDTRLLGLLARLPLRTRDRLLSRVIGLRAPRH